MTVLLRDPLGRPVIACASHEDTERLVVADTADLEHRAAWALDNDLEIE